MEQTEFEQIAKSTRAKAVATALALSMSMDEAEDIAQERRDAKALDIAQRHKQQD